MTMSPLMHRMMTSALTVKRSSSAYTWADMQVVQVWLNKLNFTKQMLFFLKIAKVQIKTPATGPLGYFVSPACLHGFLRALVQVMRFEATTRNRTRTRHRSVPQMSTMMAATLSAPLAIARWRAAAFTTTTRGGGSISAVWQISTALPKTQSETRGRGRTSCGTPGDTTESPTPSNLSPWRSGGLQPIIERWWEEMDHFNAWLKASLKQNIVLLDYYFHCDQHKIK